MDPYSMYTDPVASGVISTVICMEGMRGSMRKFTICQLISESANRKHKPIDKR